MISGMSTPWSESFTAPRTRSRARRECNLYTCLAGRMHSRRGSSGRAPFRSSRRNGPVEREELVRLIQSMRARLPVHRRCARRLPHRCPRPGSPNVGVDAFRAPGYVGARGAWSTRGGRGSSYLWRVLFVEGEAGSFSGSVLRAMSTIRWVLNGGTDHGEGLAGFADDVAVGAVDEDGSGEGRARRVVAVRARV
jgi:hypothetical protein